MRNQQTTKLPEGTNHVTLTNTESEEPQLWQMFGPSRWWRRARLELRVYVEPGQTVEVEYGNDDVWMVSAPQDEAIRGAYHRLRGYIEGCAMSAAEEDKPSLGDLQRIVDYMRDDAKRGGIEQ